MWRGKIGEEPCIEAFVVDIPLQFASLRAGLITFEAFTGDSSPRILLLKVTYRTILRNVQTNNRYSPREIKWAPGKVGHTANLLTAPDINQNKNAKVPLMHRASYEYWRLKVEGVLVAGPCFRRKNS